METNAIDGQTITTTVPHCTSCPFNTYQDKVGGKQCISCPQNHITNSTGSKSLKDCVGKSTGIIEAKILYYVAVCTPNTKSPTGLGPCENCPKNTYQKEYGKTFCTPCESEDDDPSCIKSLYIHSLEFMKLFHMIGPCEIKANFDICITSRVSVYYDIFEKSCLPAMPGTCATNRNKFLSFVDCASVCG